MSGFEKMLKIAGIDPAKIQAEATEFFSRVKERLDSLEARLTDLETDMHMQFADLINRVADLEAKLDIDKVHEKLADQDPENLDAAARQAQKDNPNAV